MQIAEDELVSDMQFTESLRVLVMVRIFLVFIARSKNRFDCIFLQPTSHLLRHQSRRHIYRICWILMNRLVPGRRQPVALLMNLPLEVGDDHVWVSFWYHDSDVGVVGIVDCSCSRWTATGLPSAEPTSCLVRWVFIEEKNVVSHYVGHSLFN